MRNRKANATHFLLKRNLFVGVCVFLILFFVMPFWGLSHIPNIKGSIMMNEYLDAREKQLTDLVSGQVMFAQSQEMTVVLYGGLGFLTAMMLFRHLFSKRQGMLYAALPDRRERDFIRRVICYSVLSIVPMVVNLILYLMIVAGNGLLGYMDWGRLLGRFGMLIIINLYGFAMGALASVLTGTYWSAILAGAVMIVGMEGLAYIWQYLAGMYLHTLPQVNFPDLIRGISPAYSLYKGFYAPGECAWIPCILSVLIALVGAYMLYRIRKVEKAERTLAFECLHSVMGFLLPLLGGSMMGLVVMMSFADEKGLFLGFILGTALTYWVGRMAFNQRFCGILKQWYLPAAAAAVLVLCAAALHMDVFGFDRFMPAREEVTAITYKPQHYHAEEVRLTSDGAVDAAYTWCTLMRDEAESLDAGINASAVAESTSSVVVTYHYGNGKTAKRYYSNNKVRVQAQPYLKTIIESDDFKNSALETAFLNDIDHINYLYMNPTAASLTDERVYERFGIYPHYNQVRADQHKDTVEKWMNALKLDILDRTFDEIKEDNLFMLQIQYSDPEKEKSGFTSVRIYPGDTNFLNAVFGENAQAIIDYAQGGFAADGRILALKVTYAMSRADIRSLNLPANETIQSVSVASGPDQVTQWLDKCQNGVAYVYYFMPDMEDKGYSRLHLYDMDEVERYQSTYGYEIPEDKTKLLNMPVPNFGTALSFIGE